VGLSRDVRTVNDAPRQTRAFSLALKHAREHLDQSLRVPELATMAGISTFQFDQRIRSLFGLSAGQYLTRLRIELSCHQLRHTALPIAQIALACGYADQTAFTRQFRKVVGLSPLQYRKAGA
jgi:AraC-like DNA-binding protein